MTEPREYAGAALNSFNLALGHNEAVMRKLLADVGVERIDPEQWYDFEWARSVYYRIEAEIGRGTVIAVGRKMIETAEFPPGLDGVAAVLSSLGDAYQLNVRGPDVGSITCELDDDYSATLVWTTRFPCALNLGIMEGSCSRFGVKALIEHGQGCVDQGAPACTYHVSW